MNGVNGVKNRIPEDTVPEFLQMEFRYPQAICEPRCRTCIIHNVYALFRASRTRLRALGSRRVYPSSSPTRHTHRADLLPQASV